MRARVVSVGVVLVGTLAAAACSGGGGDEAATTTSRPPATTAPAAGGQAQPEAFCDLGRDLVSVLTLADPNDIPAVEGAMDYFVNLFTQAAVGAPDDVTADLSYLVGRYQDAKAALTAGQSVPDALASFNEDRPRFEAALAAFSTYRQGRCPQAPGAPAPTGVSP